MLNSSLQASEVQQMMKENQFLQDKLNFQVCVRYIGYK